MKAEIYLVELWNGDKFLEIYTPMRLSPRAEKALGLYWVGADDWATTESESKGTYDYYLMSVGEVEDIISKYKNITCAEDIAGTLAGYFLKKGWDVDIRRIKVRR
ncbi:hypothetical protein [Thermococcus sp.]|uniref:hypothetical protein n=1 Tax=Thermococcus sp. TaxID=35749 RepID=UPI00262D5028|nr:hypothetical protein [Thermococcus sp.]